MGDEYDMSGSGERPQDPITRTRLTDSETAAFERPGAGGSDGTSTRIDEVCEAFESAWRSGGSRPEMLEFANRVPESLRCHLLARLLRLDVEMHRLHGLDLDSASYENVLKDLDDDSRQECLGVLSGLLDGAETVVSKTRVMGRYELRSQLGRGGFGSVFRAFDTQLERFVAVKIPSGSFATDHQQKLFLREAKAAARLEHEGIVRVLDFGISNETAYIVFELVDGVPLSTVLAHEKPKPREAGELVHQLAVALEFAHAKRIVHRDIKPSNVLIEKATNRPRLADFGLAKILDDAETMMRSGQVLGTPHYMSPEQALGRHADARSDVYSLGVLFYEMLSGRRPFDVSGKSTLIELVAFAEAVALKSVDSSLPKDACTICHKAMAKRPVDRYQTAGEFAEDLRRWLAGEPIVAQPISFVGRAIRLAKRNPLVAGMAAVAVAAVVAAVAAAARPAKTVREVVEVPAVVDGKLPVRIVTEPAGAEVTFVRLDDRLHEPDPEMLERVEGVTPLTHRLREGFYLVVAVLPDGRFHEVIRRVPNSATAGRGMGPAAMSWSWDHGIVSYGEPIEVPDAEMRVESVLISAPNGLVRQFFLARSELANGNVETAGWLDERGETVERKTGVAARLPYRTDYWDAVRRAEEVGGRLPSIAEWDAVLRLLPVDGCEKDHSTVVEDVVTPRCDTFEVDGVRVFGVQTGVGEWLSTRFGGDPLKGKPGIVALPEHWRDEQIVAGPFPEQTSDSDDDGELAGLMRTQNKQMGLRIVKSAAPRVSKTDFVGLELLDQLARQVRRSVSAR